MNRQHIDRPLQANRIWCAALAPFAAAALIMTGGCAGEEVAASADAECCGVVFCESDADCPASPLPCVRSSCAATGVCNLLIAEDDSACDDGLSCTTADHCSSGQCVAGGYAACDDGNQCTVEACVAGLDCTTIATLSGLGCDDGSPCTLIGICAGETCVADPIDVAAECDDGNPCTDAACDAVTGCGAVPNTEACDDGDPCTQSDACAAGQCAGAPRDCDDSDPCTIDSCAGQGCLHGPASGAACDDGVACTIEDHCVVGSCVGKNALFDAAPEPPLSLASTCAAPPEVPAFALHVGTPRLLAADGGGVYALEPIAGGAKLDGYGTKLATIAGLGGGIGVREGAASRYIGGSLLASATATCDSQLRVAVLPDAATATQLAFPAPQSAKVHWVGGDASKALVVGFAQQGIWQVSVEPQSNTWTESVTHAASVQSLAGVARMTNGDIAWTGAVIPEQQYAWPYRVGRNSAAGAPIWLRKTPSEAGQPIGILSRASGELIVLGRFGSTSHVLRLDGTGNVITRSAYASAGASGGIATTADGGLLLGVGTIASSTLASGLLPSSGAVIRLDAALHELWRRPMPFAVEQVAEAADGTLWFAGRSLQVHIAHADAFGATSCAASGACLGMTAAACADGNPCTHDTCTAGSCSHVVAPVATCHDDDVCVAERLCNNGGCPAGTAIDCDDDNPCTLDGCDAASGCTHTAAAGPCDDGNPCTGPDACAASACAAPALAAGSPCDDGDPCTVGDGCADGVCVPGATGQDCNDGNACTDDACAAGTGCTHAANTAPCDDGKTCIVGERCHAGVCDLTHVRSNGSVRPWTEWIYATATPVDVARAPDGQHAYALHVGLLDGLPGTSNALARRTLATGAVQVLTTTSASAGSSLSINANGTYLVWGEVGRLRSWSIANSTKSALCGSATSATNSPLDGPCATARFGWIRGITIAPDDSVWLADSFVHRLRRVSAAGIVSTEAGTGAAGHVDGPVATATLNGPSDVALDSIGRVYFVEGTGRRLRRLHQGQVTTIAGGQASAVDGVGPLAGFAGPVDLALIDDVAYVLDGEGEARAMRKVTPDGQVRRYGALPGGGLQFWSAGSQGHIGDVKMNTISRLASGGSASLWLLSGNNLLATQPSLPLDCDDDDPCSTDSCGEPAGCAHMAYVGACNDGNGCTENDSCATGTCKGTTKTCAPWDSCYDADLCTRNGACITTVPSNGPARGAVAYVAGRFDSNGEAQEGLTDGPAGVGRVGTATAMVERNDGAVVFLDHHAGTDAVRLLAPNGTITTLAATTAAAGALAQSRQVALDLAERPVIGTANGLLLRREPNGALTTLLGANGSGFADGPLATAKCGAIEGVVGQASGAIDFADATNHRLRRLHNGSATTLAGSGASGSLDGPAASARFAAIEQLCTTGAKLYVWEQTSKKLRVLTFATGAVSTLAPAVWSQTTRLLPSIGRGGARLLLGSPGQSMVFGPTVDLPYTAGVQDEFFGNERWIGRFDKYANDASKFWLPGSGILDADGGHGHLYFNGETPGPTTQAALFHLGGVLELASSDVLVTERGRVRKLQRLKISKCDDDSPCTTDTCANDGTCGHVAVTGTCDDGDPCTQATACANGQCGGGTTLSCDDDKACTADVCGPNGCQYLAFAGPCDDGSACTIADSCVGDVCVGTQTGCDDGNPCTIDQCLGSGCSHAATGAACDDGNPCTVADSCGTGSCAGTPKVCDDSNPCTKDSCGANGACQFDNDTSAKCSDGDPCSKDDHCVDGACVGSNPCDDGNDCTADGCGSDGSCLNAPANGACKLAQPGACGDAGVCDKGTCVASGAGFAHDTKATVGLAKPTTTAGSGLPTAPGESGTAIHGAVGLPGGTLLLGEKAGALTSAPLWLRINDAGQLEFNTSASLGVTAGVYGAAASAVTGVLAIAVGESTEKTGSSALAIPIATDGKAGKEWLASEGFATGLRAAAALGNDTIGVGWASGQSADQTDAFLVRLGPTLSPAWSLRFGFEKSEALAAVTVDSGGILGVGWTESSAIGRDAWLLRVSTSGALVWAKGLVLAADQEAAAVAPRGSGWLLAGRSNGDGTYRPWLAAVDAFGNQLWQRAPLAKDGVLRAVSAVGGGGFVVCGQQLTNGASNALFAAIDTFGNVQWQRVPTGPFGARCQHVHATTTGLVFAGEATSQLFAVSATSRGTDAFGNLDCASSGDCASKQVVACDDGKACTADTCSNGACKSSPLDLGAPCGDGAACSAAQVCQ